MVSAPAIHRGNRGLITLYKFDRETGRIDLAESFSIEIPPYWQDLCDAGKLVSEGWGFCNSLNSEMATGGIESGNPPFEAGVSQTRLEFVAGQGSGNGPRSIPSCPPVSPRSCPGLRSRPSRTIAHLAGVPALDPDLKGIVRDRYVASIRPSAHPHPGPSPQQSPFASGSQQEAPSLPT